MAHKELKYDTDARAALEAGVDAVANAVKVTLGPKGRYVVLDKKFGAPTITNDGVTIAREIEVEDVFENQGAQLVREVATATNDVAGDGTTTATVLAQAIVREGLKNVAAGANPLALKKGIELAVDQIVENIKQQSTEISGKDQIARTSDGEVSYYLGLARDGLGENREARASYEAAARLPAFRAAAELRLGELSAREGNLKQADSYLRLAGEAAPDDLRTAEELSAVLRAEGQQENSRKFAQQWLARFPDSYFLLEEIGKPELHHLANDTQRVLNIASEYMRLGMYTQAVQVLTRDYPPASGDESEPGQLPPNKHPLVAYYAAYCQQQLHGSATFDKAAKLSTEYVFPSRAEDLEVLSAALKSNPQDASAHYLIGTLYFSKGLADQALAEWQQARELNPQIPVLHASLGRALLHIKDKPQEAFDVFQEGLRTDAHNLELYRGIDQTLSILQKPAQERVAALQRYPDLDHMPTPLTYELILNLAEAGEFDKAEAMFHNRFFQREEGGTNVRQVWLEVELQKALFLARHAHCSEAVNIADHIAQPVPELPFTHDGLQPFLTSARFNYLLGSTYKACKLSEKSQSHFTQAAQNSNLNEVIWSWKASQELPNADHSSARQKLELALERLRSDRANRFGDWTVALPCRHAGSRTGEYPAGQ